MWARCLAQEDSLEKEMSTHSSTIAWRIPWTEKPGVHRVAKCQTRLKQLSMHTKLAIINVLLCSFFPS